jgi:hypothetical protein
MYVFSILASWVVLSFDNVSMLRGNWAVSFRAVEVASRLGLKIAWIPEM